MITVDNVTVAIGEKKLLDGVTMSAAAGEVLGLIGPNGAGKSTLLAVLTGDRDRIAGEVRIGGFDPATASPLHMAQLRAVMLQDVSVAFSFLVWDVVEMGRRPWEKTSDPETDRAVIEVALEATGVSHLAEREITTLSGGEKARVALSRVLAQQTPVVLLDEPTAAMDIGHQEQTLGIARALARSGAAVIVVMHDLNAAAAYCDRVVCLERGRVVAQGTVDEVYTSEILSGVYGWPIRVERHRDESNRKSVRVIPQRATPDISSLGFLSANSGI
ncbi:heme ABC transporter ATP-binding protein [Corynebacterium pacaense]|uniref:heme ABC transporter ATP-binding protein n=1 Tax=Corynebacterium pacaense TaxID=1816684 RepID=UPI0009BC08FB|nr:heme ABC transporter ATP-binding protein [Corynebacterium pacaense]